MQPRGYWGTFLTIAALTGLPFALIWSLLASLLQGVSFGETFRGGIWGGIFFGLFMGLILAKYLKVVTIAIPFQDRAAFLPKINIALAEIGYHPESQTETLLTFKPSFQAGLLSGKISVQIEQNSATLVGPATYVKKVQKRLGALPAKKGARRKWAIAGAIVFGSIVLLGVLVYLDGRDDQPSATTSKPAPTATATPTPTPVETLEQIVGRAALVSSVKFDVVTNATGQAQAMTLSWKANKIRMDMTFNGQKASIFGFSANHTRVIYDPVQKEAEQTQVYGDDLNSGSPAEMAENILKEKPAILGPEIIDGHPSLLIDGVDERGQNYRAWIEREHGFPVRQEIYTPDGKVVTEMKNMEFYYIPDSVFELPPGTAVTVVLSSPPPPSTKPAPTVVTLPTTVPRLYVNPDFHYSIEVPGKWTIDDNNKGNVVLHSGEPGTFVQIFAHNSKPTLDNWVSDTMDFRAKEQDFKEIARKPFTLPGSLPAYAADSQWTIKGNSSLSRCYAVMTVKDGREIELLGMSFATNWTKNQAQLQQIASTLAVENQNP